MNWINPCWNYTISLAKALAAIYFNWLVMKDWLLCRIYIWEEKLRMSCREVSMPKLKSCREASCPSYYLHCQTMKPRWTKRCTVPQLSWCKGKCAWIFHTIAKLQQQQLLPNAKQWRASSWSRLLNIKHNFSWYLPQSAIRSQCPSCFLHLHTKKVLSFQR